NDENPTNGPYARDLCHASTDSLRPTARATKVSGKDDESGQSISGSCPCAYE
ncbi:unnamed protein product, partial [marine sediment metagenome]